MHISWLMLMFENLLDRVLSASITRIPSSTNWTSASDSSFSAMVSSISRRNACGQQLSRRPSSRNHIILLRYALDMLQMYLRFSRISLRFSLDIAEISMRYVRCMPRICQHLYHIFLRYMRYNWDVPNVCLRICLRYTWDWDIHVIYLTFTWDTSKLHLRYPSYITEIYLRDDWKVPNVCLRICLR